MFALSDIHPYQKNLCIADIWSQMSGMKDALETTREARKRFERRVRILRVGMTGMMWFALPGDGTGIGGIGCRYV